MAATEKTPVTGAGPFNGILTWVDQRFPLMALWKSQLSEYYAPKNFNFWYYFGSLALLVLVIQINSRGLRYEPYMSPRAMCRYTQMKKKDAPVEWT